MKVQFCMFLLETLKVKNLTREEIQIKYFKVYNQEIDERTIHRWVVDVNCYLCNFYDYSFTILYDKTLQLFYKHELKIKS